MSTPVAGGVIAFYQIGYGIAAFGVGPLVDHGTNLSTLYGCGRSRHGPAVLRRPGAVTVPLPRLHPRPGDGRRR